MLKKAWKSLKMVIDRIFCGKSSKKSSALQHNRQNEAIQQTDTTNSHRSSHNATNNGNNNGNNNNTSNKNINNNTTTNLNPPMNIPYRYVTQDFQRVEKDEITVYAGDIVLYEFADVEDGKSWSHVSCFTRNERGFVPSEILSLEPKLFGQSIKKKMPRSIADNAIINDRHHLHHHHHHHNHHQHRAHSHKTHCTSERTCHSNGGSIKLQQPHLMRLEQTPHFSPDLAINSLQGSSGCPTFQKFSDFPGSYYYNLNSPQYNEYQPFSIWDNNEFCVVMHNFVAREENDLEVKPADSVTLLNKDDKDWFWVRRQDGQEGFVPARFIVPLVQFEEIMHKGNSTVTMKSSNQIDFHTYINQPGRDSLTTDQQSSNPPILYPGL